MTTSSQRALFVPCEMNVFMSVCFELMFYAPSPGYEALISQLSRDQLTPHFLPRASNRDHSSCVCESLLYLLWSRLSLQQSGTLIASIHYSALLQLHRTPKQHRNKTRLRIGMKCVSELEQVEETGEVWAFICAPSFINCPGAQTASFSVIFNACAE